MWLHVCYKYKNNHLYHLYHVSKEDVKMVVLFRCWVFFVLQERYWFHMFEKLAVKPCHLSLSPFLYSLFTRQHNRQYLKIIASIFFSMFDLMNCCKFQKPMTKPILKESIVKLCLNTRCFTSTKIIYPTWCYLTYCWYWRHKNI